MSDVTGRGETQQPGPRGIIAKPWFPLALRGIGVLVVGYAAVGAALVSLLAGSALLSTEPAHTVSGVGVFIGGVLVLPVLLYYGLARLTARSSPLTTTGKGRLRWSLTAYALTLLLTVVLNPDFSPVLVALVPAAFIVGKRTFWTAVAACAVLVCVLLASW